MARARARREDSDGYALERRVRLTLQAAPPAPVAQAAARQGRGAVRRDAAADRGGTEKR